MQASAMTSGTPRKLRHRVASTRRRRPAMMTSRTWYVPSPCLLTASQTRRRRIRRRLRLWAIRSRRRPPTRVLCAPNAISSCEIWRNRRRITKVWGSLLSLLLSFRDDTYNQHIPYRTAYRTVFVSERYLCQNECQFVHRWLLYAFCFQWW